MSEPLTDAGGNVREVTLEKLTKFRPLSEVNPELYARIKKHPVNGYSQ